MATVVKRPSGKWQATVRSDGRSRSKSFTRRADAVRWSYETELQAERGELQDKSAPDAEVMTLAGALERYRDAITATKGCEQTERCAINALLRKKLARTKLDKLTSAQIAAHRDRRLQRCKPSTVVRELGWLQHAIDVACSDWGQSTPNGNPVKQVRRPRIDNRRERRLRAGEREALLEVAATYRNPLIRPLIVLALETGMRRGELLSMCWQDFDPARSVVTLRRTKNGKARTVPLTARAVETIEQLPRTDDRILPLRGDSVRQAWERIRARASCNDLCFHDLRHERLSQLVEAGFSLAQVQMVSGHSDLRMLGRYVHLAVDDIVELLRS